MKNSITTQDIETAVNIIDSEEDAHVKLSKILVLRDKYNKNNDKWHPFRVFDEWENDDGESEKVKSVLILDNFYLFKRFLKSNLMSTVEIVD